MSIIIHLSNIIRILNTCIKSKTIFKQENEMKMTNSLIIEENRSVKSCLTIVLSLLLLLLFFFFLNYNYNYYRHLS
jgi:hypothetical protein